MSFGNLKPDPYADRGAITEEYGEDVPQETPVEAECIFCKKTTPHVDNGVSLWCRKCGCSSKRNEEQQIFNANIDKAIRDQTAVTSSGPRTRVGDAQELRKLWEADPIRKYKAKLVERIAKLQAKLKLKTSRPQKDQDKKEIAVIKKKIDEYQKIVDQEDITPNIQRQSKLQERLQTDTEKQEQLNGRRVEDILSVLCGTLRGTRKKTVLEEAALAIWRRTLQYKLQTGRNVIVNTVACFNIASKYQKKKPADTSQYHSLIEEFFPDPKNITERELKKYIWHAESLIFQKMRPSGKRKQPCNINKETGELDVRLFASKADWLKNGCPRSDWDLPPNDLQEEIEKTVGRLVQQNTIKFPVDTILESAKSIFRDADEKGLLSGKKSKTIIVSIIYLAFIAKNIQPSNWVDFIYNEVFGISSERGIKEICNAVNDRLKLGLTLQF
jgi:hypothetical protein